MSSETETRADVAPARTEEAAEIYGGRFRIVSVLGRGASGITYLVEETATGKRLAMKALKARAIGEWKQFELFEREARVLGGLRHHGVPELVAFFEHPSNEGPELCLVMEWIEGASLAHRIAHGPRLDQVEVMQLASDLLDVLVYLHGRSPPVFHRDIKPSNIVIRKDGAPVLIDFGGVCDGWREPAQSGDTIVGTTGYMPPEQYMGQVGPWSDLYALGATLLHLLTGRPPADHDYGAGRHSLPAGIDAHPRLRAFVDAVLAPAPNARPQTAADARRLLMNDAPAPSPAAARSPAPAHSPAPEPMRPLYDPGRPPRDPAGPHAALYKEMRKTFTYGWGCLVHTLALGLTIALPAVFEHFVFAGIGLLVWMIAGQVLSAAQRAKDKKIPPDGTPGAMLFINGHYAVAEVTDRQQSESSFAVIYSYRAGGIPISGRMSTSMLKGLALAPGTRFGVIYSEEVPKTHHVIKQDLPDPK